MLFSAITTVILSVASLASAHASSSDSSSGIVKVNARKYNHRQIARSVPSSSSSSSYKASSTLKKRASPKKRRSCSASQSGNSTTTSSSSSGSSGSAGSSSHSNSTHTASASGSSSTGLSSGSGGSSGGKVVNIDDPVCGKNNPSASTTNSAGPNGEESWFNCGLTGGGWTPPKMDISQMIYVSLEDAMKMPNTPFSPCKSHVSLFQQYGQKYGIPDIMLASFAMQESTCNQNVYNSAGTIGMFQLAPQNCPGVDCTNLETNIEQACKLIIQYLKDADNNVINMVGGYNGWYSKMTKSKAESAPCNQQQNLDYLQQFFNAWLQGQNGYNVGTYHNCAGNYSKKKRSLFVPRFARDESVAEQGWSF